MLEAVSSREDACSSVRWLRSALPCDISLAAVEIALEDARIQAECVQEAIQELGVNV